ncbi:LysR family transcriptional regulator [Pseudobacteriovorax antillogorgiicola]|uniref:DNA-binding transcriptional regulator, LysR family n=1 Tax=Pseudobacteriovorax antillogorgiicola TaxID=1513793 RepID=A0A1Y6CZ24_9BACT|nr:LysR family transcriptional regulator [Pseudobacteriovorax antillogorgiicola]TCS40921.1 DNA-binding transcriptional LysR family regulator [Pseudobacteriovorax antillogorgiicola]SMF83982.1 DNA-binding transcriptional regulator, LysR family [Pseudobacteriovorax antillogorgiicola]
MTLDQIEAFVIVAEERGLRAASKRLHKTQPAVSTAIKNLEQELRLRLFDRDGYRVQLSEAGNAMLPQARKILAEAQSLNLHAQELSAGREARLHLVFDYLCPHKLISELLRRTHDSCGAITLDLSFEVLQGAEERLLDGDGQIAITPFWSQSERLFSQPLCNLHLEPVCIADQLDGQSRLARGLPQIVAHDSSQKALRDDFNSPLGGPVWYVSDHQVKETLIKEGHGWGYLEVSAISKLKDSGRLKLMLYEELPRRTVQLFLLRSKNKPFGPIARDVWATTQAVFADD